MTSNVARALLLAVSAVVAVERVGLPVYHFVANDNPAGEHARGGWTPALSARWKEKT